MNYVVDASVFAMLFMPEEASAEAESLLAGASELAAPKLAVVETAASFFRRVRKGMLTAAAAVKAAEAWRATLDSGAIVFHDDAGVWFGACSLALKLNHAVQDCVYLELARQLDYHLLTGDVVFGLKAREVHPQVTIVAAGTAYLPHSSPPHQP